MSCEMKERPPLASSTFLYFCLCKSGRMAYLLQQLKITKYSAMDHDSEADVKVYAL
jgi:hypothetical protein